MTKKPPPKDVFIGKFDILATYAYARALLDGLDDDEAKQRGMVAAITWGAKITGKQFEERVKAYSRSDLLFQQEETTGGQALQPRHPCVSFSHRQGRGRGGRPKVLSAAAVVFGRDVCFAVTGKTASL
jgi:hypothetical protein